MPFNILTILLNMPLFIHTKTSLNMYLKGHCTEKLNIDGFLTQKNGLFRHTGAMVTFPDQGLFWHTGAMVTNLVYGLFRYTGAMVTRHDPGLIGISKGKITGPDYELWLDSMVKVRHVGTGSQAISRVIVKDHSPWYHGNILAMFRPY